MFPGAPSRVQNRAEFTEERGEPALIRVQQTWFYLFSFA